MTRSFMTLLLSAALLFTLPALAQETRFITIGTGALTGVYYPTGGAICRLVNRNRQEHQIRCSVESTGGSIFNLNTLRNGEMDFGIAQSDWQHHSYHGTSEFAERGADTNLRSLFSLHGEPFTLMVREQSAIHALEDLPGKRVNIGNPGSGQRATMEVLMQRLGWNQQTFALASELRAAEQSRALCDNRIDAMIYAVGHPNASIQEAVASCNARLVPVTGEAVEALIAERSYYTLATIPAGMYQEEQPEIATFGVKATLVTSATVDEEVVYQLVKALFENLEAFRSLHPAFAHLRAEQMLEGQSAPLHPGALRYYQESGLLP